MRFFSRLVFLCNICFIITMVMRFVERGNTAKGNTESIIKLQPLENTLIILGYSAIILNVVFVLITLFFYASRKAIKAPKWIVWINLLIFVLQVYYFFYTN